MRSSIKVAEFGERTIVVEVYQKYLSSVNKYFFDVVCASECVEGVNRFLSPLSRVENIPRMISAVVDAMEYIAVRHKDLRSSEAVLNSSEGGVSVPYKYCNSTCSGADGIEFEEMQRHVLHVKEFKRGSVVCELYTEETNAVNVFKFCCWREYPDSDGILRREFYIQQRDLRDLIKSLVDVQVYVKENWGTQGSIDSKRW